MPIGFFFHNWVDNDDNLHVLQVLQSYSESDMQTDQAVPVNDDGGVSPEPPNDENQAPFPKRGWFHNATDEELTVAAAKNTKVTTAGLCDSQSSRLG